MTKSNRFKKLFRFVWITGFSLLIFLGLLRLSPLRVNLSSSMPIGVYLWLPNDWIDRGDIVAVCLPEAMAIEGKEKGYLLSGQCPGGAKPILKKVIAVPGDTVYVSDSGILITRNLSVPSRIKFESSQISVDVFFEQSNVKISPLNSTLQIGYHHFYSAPQLHEDHNQLMIHRWIQNGIYHPVQSVWLYGANDPVHSWDSRYFGGIPIKNIIGIYEKIWVISSQSSTTSNLRGD